MIYWICHFLLGILSILYYPTKVKGLENIPKKGPFIFASNHISNLDPFLLGFCLSRRVYFLAKEELFKTRFTAWLFKQLGSIPIKRDSSDFRAIRNTLKYLKEGKPLVIFPEGTRGISEREKKAQPGIGLIAKKSKVPIIPVNIRGSDKALPNDAKWFKRHKIEVLIGPPLSVEYEIDNENISQVILDAIYALDFNNANITE